MTTHPAAPSRFSFGPFQVDTVLGELRRDGIRLRLAGQPFRILLALVARPGELVTREELRSEVWSGETFVDFEHGLNAAVNKLRRALGDAAENPKYIETHPGRGYRFVGTLKAAESAPVVAAEPLVPVEAPVSPTPRAWWWLVGAAVCAVLAVVGWRMSHNTTEPQAEWKVTRLTVDKGITNSGALSRDGKLAAYSSDRAHAGEMELYVTQVGGGQPIQLTTDGVNNTNPDFSPDGSKIVFHSTREGGGIYEIGAFGGEARLLVKHGLNPRYSPDGTEVVYWVGEPMVVSTVPGSGEVWVVPVAGGAPRRVGAQFTNARFPIWAPDGKHVLLIGYTADKPADGTAVDWFVVATHGDDAVRTGVYEALSRGGLRMPGAPTRPSATFQQVPIPGCWLTAENSVVFSARAGDTQSLWEAVLSPHTNQATRLFRRLTAGAGDEFQPSCASHDAIAFTSGEDRRAIWSVKTDLNTGRTQGEPELLTTGSTDSEPSLSADGRFVSFSSARSGELNIWVREFATGKERRLAASTEGQRFSYLDATGSRVAYSVFEKSGRRSTYLWTRDEAPQRICVDCLKATGWTPDGKKVAVYGGSPLRIDLVDVETHEQTPLVSHKTYNVVLGRLSPDGRWISFTARVKPNKAMIAVAPLNGIYPIPESAWIKIADEEPEDRAAWSPDGKMLYFTSQRDGHKCLYAQRIDGISRRPVGEPFAVQHFHGRLSYEDGGWAVANGKIIFGLVDGRENVWMMSRAGWASQRAMRVIAVF